jgi:hypothetical protein
MEPSSVNAPEATPPKRGRKSKVNGSGAGEAIAPSLAVLVDRI